jgi:hypothetical protein
MKNLGDVMSTIFGESFLDKLQKNGDIGVLKPLAGYTTNGAEIATALNVIPRAVMSWLVLNVLPMKVGDIMSRPLDPIDPLVTCNVQKIDRDLYNGSLDLGGREITRWKNRTLPGIGMVILSTLELYKPEEVLAMPEQAPKEAAAVQLNVNHEMIARDASKADMFAQMTYEEILRFRIQTEMELNRLRAEVRTMKEPQEGEPGPVGFKLRRFLENRDIQKREGTFQVILSKGEEVSCPDCGQSVYSEEQFHPCVCFGENRNSKIFLKKNEHGTTLKFSKNWDPENVEMLLDILKRRNK